jgi:hypothetical protein
VVRDQHIVSRLKGIDYTQIAGNRFARGLTDIPAGLIGERDSSSPETFIDVLVPAYTSRAHENVQIGEDLFTTEVLGLQLALARHPVVITLTLRRLNGQTLKCEVPFADELSALVLKSLATDMADIWRCLEVAFAAELRPTDFAKGIRADAAEVIRTLFAARREPAMEALAREQHLSGEAADERFTRVQALITYVLGSTGPEKA